MITDTEIIQDIEKVMAKVEWMAVTYKNNDIWKQINNELDNIKTKLKKDKRVYGY